MFSFHLTAGADEGRTPLLSLLRSIGARPAAMGEAFVAAPADIQNLGFNPANLARLSCPALSSTYFSGIADDNFGNLNYAHSLPFGSIFIGGAHYDAGNFDLTVGGVDQGRRKAQTDSAGLIGFALGRDIPVSIGVTGKFYKSELAEQATASGFAADAGVVWNTPLSGLGLGAAIQNVGPDLQYEVDKEPLPQTIRVGAAYEIDMEKLNVFRRIPYQALITVDGVKTRNRDSSVNSGLELRRSLEIMEQIGYAALRGGYQSEAKQATAGIGFKIGSFILDYAIIFPTEDVDNTHRVTLSWLFQPAKEKIGNKHLR